MPGFFRWFLVFLKFIPASATFPTMNSLLQTESSGRMAMSPQADSSVKFLAARPVWLVDHHQDMNLTAGFRCVIHIREGVLCRLRLTARTTYRAWCDGRFAGYGPARSAHGHLRVDEWILSDLTEGAHLIAVEVNACNVPGYAMTDEYPLLQAEVEVDGRVVAATGCQDASTIWQALIPGERIQRIQRNSRQRGFAEACRLTPVSSAWRSTIDATVAALPVESVTQPVLQPRRVPYPEFRKVYPIQVVGGGTIQIDSDPVLHKWEEWMRAENGKSFAGYPHDQWEVDLSEELGCCRCLSSKPQEDVSSTTMELSAGSWRMVDFGVNQTGFIRARIHCRTAAVVYLAGDELTTNGDCDCRRLEYMAGVRYELAPGVYDLEMFESVTLRYLKVMVRSGDVRVEDLSLREYARSTVATFDSPDKELNEIVQAAVRTFAQNAVDIFMDCPSRERAGWLCDSFFTGRVEPWLTGGCLAETVFIENYACCPSLPYLPAGMLPKCYPGDGPMNRGGQSSFIPNWAMWLVLELAEYRSRGGDAGIVDAFRSRCEALLAYLDRFLNSDGLLEKLESWVFVDWSSSNEFVQDVSYPTNMLYAEVLESAGRLFGHVPWVERANEMRTAIIRQAWDGHYFIDNARRDEQGRLVPTGHHTETCQYYAFFFGLATPTTHRDLWNELLESCSVTPGVINPQLPRAGHLPGFHLRMSLLGRYGEISRLMEEIRSGFLPMIELTGTLWEHEHSRNSCNHAFAAHVAHLIFQHILGLSVDRVRREVRLMVPSLNMPWCRAQIPLDGKLIDIGWENTVSGGKVEKPPLPAGWHWVTDPSGDLTRF